MAKTRCPLRDVYCEVHEHIHGREAEELRDGLEKLDFADYADPDGRICIDAANGLIVDLLDRIDARDSLAWLERRDRKKLPAKRLRRQPKKRNRK